jgi:hypothetical protein
MVSVCHKLCSTASFKRLDDEVHRYSMRDWSPQCVVLLSMATAQVNAVHRLWTALDLIYKTAADTFTHQIVSSNEGERASPLHC